MKHILNIRISQLYKENFKYLPKQDRTSPSVSGNIISAENIISTKTAPKLEYGKHAYAPNVKTESIKNIKILPPLLLRPIPSIGKKIVTVYRTKRNVSNLTNSENINQHTEVENGTVPSVKIDQVTQAITVTQISGTPPPSNDKEVTPSLNFQPFSITSSDFKNNSAIVSSGKVDEEIEVAKLLIDKLKEGTTHFDFEDQYSNKQTNSEEKEDIIDDKYKENDAENIKQIDQNEEQEESREDKQEKYQNSEEAKNQPEKESLIINVPEPAFDNKEETQNKEESSFEDEKSKKEHIEEFPAIDEFLKHIIPSKAEENSNENKQELKKPNTKETLNFDFSLETQDKENEEIQEEKTIFDEFLSEQKEANDKLRTEMEYPDLDDDYEKYRQDALSSYLGTKEYNFKTASKPYEINLEGYFPHVKQSQNNDGVEDNENNKMTQHVYRDEEDEQKEAQVEDIQNENDEGSSETKYIYWPLEKEKSEIIETKSDKNTPNEHPESSAIHIQELNKILDKKNAISRQQEINNPKQYKTFWSLKYKVPK